MFSRVRREQDAGSDLWCVYNRAQESLIKGGVRLRPKPGARRKVLQARETRAVDAVVTYNRKLWELAQDFLPA